MEGSGGVIVGHVGMKWRGESDWDEGEGSEGECWMVVLKDEDGRRGKLVRSVGYAEKTAAVGRWRLTMDGVFVLETAYEAGKF